MHRLKLIIPFLQSNKYILILYLIFTILSYPLESIIIPAIFGDFFSEIKSNDNSNYKTLFLKTIFFTILINLSYSIMGYLDSFLIPKFNEYIVNYIYKKLLQNSQNSYSDLELGRIVSRLNTLPSIIRELTTDLFNWLLPRFLTLFIINIYLFIANPMLGFISVFLLGFLLYYNLNNYNSCVKLSEEKYKLYENRAEETQDKLSNLFAIYSSAKIDEEIKIYENNNIKYKESFTKAILCSSKIKFINNFIQCLMFIILNGIVIYLFKNEKISFAKMLTLNMIISYYLPCVSTIMSSLPDYVAHIGIIKSLDDFLKTLDQETIIKPNINISSGSISIKNLTFGYNTQILFDNFNLEIKAGEKIGLLGESGNGKSSLIKLIMGYYPVINNTILIDNQDINNYNLNSTRSQITYINQNTKLFNETIYYNIQYGNNLTIQDIDDLIKRFNLTSIFSNLKDNLNTKTGVNGDKLSGGQKQIIQILKAFGTSCKTNTSDKKTKIIILDEPTASVDIKHKSIILDIIKELSKDATLILVTHDIDNLKIVDRIIKISHGKII